MIELFAGSEVWSKGMRRRRCKVYSFDILQGPEGDLLRPQVVRRVLGLVRSGHCLGVLAGVPCTTFSIARGGHNAIRSRDFPAGLPGLSTRLQGQVEEGNNLFYNAVKVFDQCIRYHVPFLWENPQSSFMWKMPDAFRILSRPHVEDVITHYCGWGTSWKKPTRFRVYRLPGADRLHKKCTGRGGFCSFTGESHHVLQGRDPSGVHWTRRANPYPDTLVKQLCSVFQDAAFAAQFPLSVKASKDL